VFDADGEDVVLLHPVVGEGAGGDAGDGDVADGAVAGGVLGREHGDAGDGAGGVGPGAVEVGEAGELAGAADGFVEADGLGEARMFAANEVEETLLGPE
jgi:hypothetical protein